MKTIGLITCLASAALFSCSDDNPPANTGPDAPVAAQPVVYTVTLTTTQASCATGKTPSAGATGTGTVTVNPDNSIAVTNFTFTGVTSGATLAHIHFGAAGATGPVAVAFPNPSGTSGTIANKTFVAADYANPSGGPADFAAFAAALRTNNNGYLNIHSMDCPGGELRAQLTH